MKKLLYIVTCVYTAFPLSLTVSAEEITKENAPMRFADVLASALYFIGVLALIYLILALVSRWGKKNPEKKEADFCADEKNGDNAESKAEESDPEENEKDDADE